MLELTFVTSNNEKLAHARYLCRDYPVLIRKKKNYGIGYLEPRIGDREELIRQSVEDAIVRFRKNETNPDDKFFFIEDTSVIIHGLSQGREYPGVDVKYWMRENNFSSIDEMLKKNGNDRRVTVRSDVVLVLNKSLKGELNQQYKVFTSTTEGTFIEKELKIKSQPLYPWLNDRTFNKWFVPVGEKKSLSALTINEADKYDFRKGAFHEMLDFLKSHEYLASKSRYKNNQLSLFGPCVFLVCGPSCAGKTSLSIYLQKNFHYYHLEASDFMYLSYHENHGINSDITIGDFALVALKKNPSIVVDQIISNIKNLKYIPLVITGFRSPDEVENFNKKYTGELGVEVVFVDADEEIRFKRNLIRNRADAQKNIEDFRKKDLQQEKMGLKSILKSCDNLILNEKSFEHYFESFTEIYKTELNSIDYNTKYYRKKALSKWSNLQNAIIQALYRADESKYYTTTEIAHLIKSQNIILPKNKNNISRYFNQNFHPYYDIQKREDGTASYKLSQTGLSYVKWLIQYN